MNIDNMTYGELKQIAALFSGNKEKESTLKSMIGEKVIIRTYSAGVHYGTLSEKCGEEVILSNSRRLWKWWAKESISLSAVAKFGIKHDKSKVSCVVENIWLKAEEIIPCTQSAINSIEEAPIVEAE